MISSILHSNVIVIVNVAVGRSAEQAADQSIFQEECNIIINNSNYSIILETDRKKITGGR